MRTLPKIVSASLATVLLVAVISPSVKAASDDFEREEERNRAIIAKGLQAWSDGTGSPYDYLASDASWTITGNSRAAKTYPSKEAFLSEVIRPFNARLSQRLIPKVHRLYAEGDTVVAHFDAKGVALDGKPYVNSYAWILRLDGGQIVEAHAFFDSIAFDDLWTRVAPATGS